MLGGIESQSSAWEANVLKPLKHPADVTAITFYYFHPNCHSMFRGQPKVMTNGTVCLEAVCNCQGAFYKNFGDRL